MSANLRNALQRLGVPRVEAALVAFLQEHDDAATHDIMEATELRQPEVSVGMRRLKARGWVASEPIPREGKGRPMNRYKRTVSEKDIHDHYERHAKKAIAALETAWQDAADQLQALHAV